MRGLRGCKEAVVDRDDLRWNFCSDLPAYIRAFAREDTCESGSRLKR